MDKLLDAVKDICKAVDWDKRDARALSEADQQRALVAAVTLKEVYKDLPKDTQGAIATLLELMSSVAKAETPPETKDDPQKNILEILESIQQNVVNTEHKMEASEKQLDVVTKEIKEGLTNLGTRLDKVEKSTGDSKSKAPEDEPKVKVEKEKGELSWRSAVPDLVIANNYAKGGD